MRLAMLRIKVSDARVRDPGVRRIEKATKRIELDRAIPVGRDRPDQRGTGRAGNALIYAPP
jgi:hypothetical protein